MIPVSLHKIACIVGAKHIGLDVVIDTISINSNIIRNRCMFIALIGNRFNGHDFAEQAVLFGAQALLLNHYLLLDVPQLIVVDTYKALSKIANWVRCQVSSKCIAITGSSGKTSVKEMTTAILKNKGKVVATPGNFNNLIGVSMTLLELTNQDDFAVIELGTSKIGELNQLSSIVSANVALVNNIFPAHLLGFKSLNALKQEKGEVFFGLSDDGYAVINADNHAFSTWNVILEGKNIWRFSLYNKKNINVFANNIHFHKNGTSFILNGPFGVESVFLSMLGLHNVANALAASTIAFSMGATLSQIVSGLQSSKTLPGRLFPIVLNKGKLLLLDDTYNSNVGSMVSAIQVLNKMPGYRILVISDMSELGESQSIKYHCDIGKLIMRTNINQVLTIGNISYFVSKICGKGRHFRSKDAIILYLEKILYRHNNISLLIKGSRVFKMEQIVNSIREKLIC